MTEATITKITTSLAKQMAQPGGRTAEEMERRANERLERHRGDVMQTINQRIADLEALTRAKAEGTQTQVYPLVSRLLDTGGFFDTGPFYEAGYSLCETADLLMASGKWNWPSIEVHVHAMRLIFNNGCKSDQISDTLMQGLKAILAKARSDAEA